MGILCKETEESKIKTFLKNQQTNNNKEKQPTKHAALQEQTNFHRKTKHFQYTDKGYRNTLRVCPYGKFISRNMNNRSCGLYLFTAIAIPIPFCISYNLTLCLHLRFKQPKHLLQLC